MYVSSWAKPPALGALALKTCGVNNGGVRNALLHPPQLQAAVQESADVCWQQGMRSCTTAIYRKPLLLEYPMHSNCCTAVESISQKPGRELRHTSLQIQQGKVVT